MRENGLFLALLCLVAMIALGCLSLGRSAQSKEKADSAPIATVEMDEIEVPSLPKGCVETIEELPSSYVYEKTNPSLQSDYLIVVVKETRRLMLFSGGTLRHDRPGNAPDCWRIGLGPEPVFDKLAEGDGRTPVGPFRTSDKPWSQYHGAILVHYPSTRHAEQAYRQGRIDERTLDKIVRANLNGTTPPQDTPLGGDILVHGGGSSSDWTLGCIALNNADIDELRSFLPEGMKTWILIIP